MGGGQGGRRRYRSLSSPLDTPAAVSLLGLRPPPNAYGVVLLWTLAALTAAFGNEVLPWMDRWHPFGK